MARCAISAAFSSGAIPRVKPASRCNPSARYDAGGGNRSAISLPFRPLHLGREEHHKLIPAVLFPGLLIVAGIGGIIFALGEGVHA